MNPKNNEENPMAEFEAEMEKAVVKLRKFGWGTYEEGIDEGKKIERARFKKELLEKKKVDEEWYIKTCMIAEYCPEVISAQHYAFGHVWEDARQSVLEILEKRIRFMKKAEKETPASEDRDEYLMNRARRDELEIMIEKLTQKNEDNI